ncbi:hypothetical protein RRG08_062580 [Elysia crispata]|uniref:Uncharacterized protein n=1 Tax=Elysia crispata TaxID=231223 RepID=A0AAE1APD3_9GAST|nr:hypothetical protein RRG08_062580 [Elysia crispata]
MLSGRPSTKTGRCDMQYYTDNGLPSYQTELIRCSESSDQEKTDNRSLTWVAQSGAETSRRLVTMAALPHDTPAAPR